MGVDQPDTIKPIVFDLSHRALMRHEPLSRDIGRWINLQKDQIPLTLSEYLLESIKIRKLLKVLALGHTHQLNLIRNQLIPLIGLVQGVEGLDMGVSGET